MTPIRTARIARSDLSLFQVLILPETGRGGGYSDVLGEQVHVPKPERRGWWRRAAAVCLALAGAGHGVHTVALLARSVEYAVAAGWRPAAAVFSALARAGHVVAAVALLA